MKSAIVSVSLEIPVESEVDLTEEQVLEKVCEQVKGKCLCDLPACFDIESLDFTDEEIKAMENGQRINA